MTTEAKIQITSTELGTLWMGYQSMTSRLVMYEFFKTKIIDNEAQDIMTGIITETQNLKDKKISIFNNQGTVIPIAFDKRDVIAESPPLFDDIYIIMFIRQMMKLNLGHFALYTAMSYDKAVLARPPYVTFPKQIEFIESKHYMSGFNPFTQTRSLNTIEVGYLNEVIEDNIFGMMLMTGFAQVATESEVKKYFIEGKELSKKIISKLGDVLLKSDIQPTSTWAGKATDSTKSPFSDKLMMYVTNLISSSALGYSALGTSFSMRSDLQLQLTLIAKDTFEYSKKGGKIMIDHKWMEEPPQMEDRNQLTK